MPPYRIALGPVPTPIAPRHEVLHVAEDGTSRHGLGGSFEEALAVLDAEADEGWCASESLVERSGAGSVGLPNDAQKAAIFRHLLFLTDPTLAVDCPRDDILISLFDALAARVAMGAGTPGSSRPYRFQAGGAYDAAGHAILSTSEAGFTILAVREAEDVRAVYTGEADTVNLVGVVVDEEPAWAATAIEELTGQWFVPSPMVRLHGTAAPFGPKSTFLMAMLAVVWPEGSGVHEARYRLKAGAGHMVLTAVDP